ncbi:alpha/beta hydrolase [Nonomuraea angiospora]
MLLTNSGGPGGAGLAFPAVLRDLGLPRSVLDSSDVIGMDPRGVGHSTPVTCGLKPEQLASNIPKFARNAADVAAQAEYVAGIAQRCGSSATASMLPYITTANTARDMDRIREALGESKVSYFGISYGTYLGSVYTTLFPQRSDRILLDSATGPGGWDASFTRMLSRGVEDRFPDFAKFAAAHPEYGLGRTPEQESPPGPPNVENMLAGQLHVICNDSDWPESVRTYQRNVAIDRVRFPMFGAAGANITPCAFWPSEPPVQITDRGPSNVLILQNLRDPATPPAGARQLRKAFGDRGRMVTADQGGHLAYLFMKNPCVNDIATEFLVTGERPRQDVACPA